MTREQIYILAGAALLVVAIIMIMVGNTRKARIKSQLEEINVRFNNVKTAPIAFKLNKAQAMAKRNEETSGEVQAYYQRYEDVQKHIDQVQELINNLEDSIALKQSKQIDESIRIVNENISDLEKEIEVIDQFLEKFQKEENEIREYSADLKEIFRNLKLSVFENKNSLSIANEGVEERLTAVENIFSSSEEWMYANDYSKAKEDLDAIAKEIEAIKADITKLPEMIKDVKGVLPVMIDEVTREYALSRQKGIYVQHLDIDSKLEKIKADLNADTKTILEARCGNVEEHVSYAKDTLKNIMESLNAENSSYDESRTTLAKVRECLEETKKIHEYVSGSYQSEQERFGLEDLKPYLENETAKIREFEKASLRLSNELEDSKAASTDLLSRITELYNNIEVERKSLLSYKMSFDQTSSDEQRAISQLQKLQVVVNEVEVKVKEYRLPAISDSYYEDLKKCREYIEQLKELLDQIPINVETLNKTLNEAIDFIYTFYNNVNNIVGMAIMVENAIVFGNKYRSTYPEVDRELSKAEFSYLNGEYTKALTIAIKCMESLFPNATDEVMLENA